MKIENFKITGKWLFVESDAYFLPSLNRIICSFNIHGAPVIRLYFNNNNATETYLFESEEDRNKVFNKIIDSTFNWDIF